MTHETIDSDEDELPEFFYPALLQLGLTYRCNLECPHCYALYRRTRAELSTDEVKRLIDAAVKLGSCKVVYSHGENLIRKDFYELARFIRAHGMFQTLMANGYFLRTDDQVQRLADAGIDKVMISLDSSRRDEHCDNRGKRDAFDWALDALERIVASDLQVGISMAIDTRNYKRIHEVAEIGEKLGVDFISLMQVRPNQPQVFARYDWSSYEAVCRDMYELILEYEGRIDIYTHDPFMITLLDDRVVGEARAHFIAHNRCNVGKFMMSVAPDGEVTGCNFIERSVGNVRATPLADIWDRLVTEYDDRAWNHGPCSGCRNQAVCGNGCKAFHLPFESKYDKRCENGRFADQGLHALSGRLVLPVVS